MPLPRITSPKPLIIPAREEKVYPDAFMTTLLIKASPTEPWSAQVGLHNFNYDTGEFAPSSNIVPVTIPSLQYEASRSPMVAQVLGGVITVVALLLDERRGLADLDSYTKALTAANLLDDSDPTKAQKIADAQSGIDAANLVISTARTALGIQ